MPDDLDAENPEISANLQGTSSFIAHFTETDEGTRKQMIHYWVFTDDLPNNAPLKYVEPVYSISDGAYIRYEPAVENYPPDDGTSGIMDRVNDPIQMNYHPVYHSGLSFDDSGMRGIRLRNPSLVDGNYSSVIFSTPSTGFQDLDFTFAAIRTGNGQPKLKFEYSTDPNNENWSNSGLEKKSAILYEVYKTIRLSLTGIEAAENNPDLKIRVLFDGDDSILTGSDGNVRFNNLSLTGIPGDFIPPADEDDLLHYWIFTETLPEATSLDTIDSHFSKIGTAFLEYKREGSLSVDNGLGILDRVDDPSSLNFKSSRFNDLIYNDAEITGVRARNPTVSDDSESTLILHTPSNHHEIKQLIFAARRTPNGPKKLLLETNVSGNGDDWTGDGLEHTEFALFETYSLYTVNLNGVAGAENNPDFRLRIRFAGDAEYRAGNNGNVRFNHFSIHGTEGDFEDHEIPEPVTEIKLHQNYPNPYNSSTSISYSLPEEMSVELSVYDMLGRRVATLQSEVQQEGTHTIQFDSSQLSSGIYLYRLFAGGTILQRKMTLIK
ncbi:MAG: T9SS type A sorting domain-containing protein [Balneolaceae bacterium]|nr:T9SS type A sorting domain-containing protein [Balneolaceae bacterium]